MSKEIGKNADGDYIIDGRLYTKHNDNTYHLLPISMDEAKTTDRQKVYTQKEIDLLEQGFDYQIDEDMTKINTSLILDSCIIATLSKDDINIEIKCTGEKHIDYNGDYYKYAKDMPDELIQILNQPDFAINQPDNIYIGSNNWFEINAYDGSDVIHGFDDVVDIEGFTVDQLLDTLKDAYDDVLKEQKKEYEERI